MMARKILEADLNLMVLFLIFCEIEFFVFSKMVFQSGTRLFSVNNFVLRTHLYSWYLGS